MDTTNDNPNWQAILEDEVRQQEEVPWLNFEIERAIDNACEGKSPGTQYWDGFRRALTMVRDRPAQEVQGAVDREAERRALIEQQEKEKDARRVPAGGGYFTRVAIPGIGEWWDRARGKSRSGS